MLIKAKEHVLGITTKTVPNLLVVKCSAHTTLYVRRTNPGSMGMWQAGIGHLQDDVRWRCVTTSTRML